MVVVSSNANQLNFVGRTDDRRGGFPVKWSGDRLTRKRCRVEGFTVQREGRSPTLVVAFDYEETAKQCAEMMTAIGAKAK